MPSFRKDDPAPKDETKKATSKKQAKAKSNQMTETDVAEAVEFYRIGLSLPSDLLAETDDLVHARKKQDRGYTRSKMIQTAMREYLERQTD